MSDNVGKIGDDSSDADPRNETDLVPAFQPGTPSRAVNGELAAVDPFAAGARAIRVFVEGQLSPRSKQGAMDSLRRVARTISGEKSPADYPWPRLAYEDALRIRAALFEGTRAGWFSPATANVTLSHLRGLIRTMYGMGMVTPEQLAFTDKQGPLKSIKGHRDSRGNDLKPTQETALREAARGLSGYRGPMLDSAIVLAIGGGLRREEIASATLEGLELEGLRIIGKGNRERRIHIDDRMQETLDIWLKLREELAPNHGAIFCSPERFNRPLAKWTFWAMVREAAHIAFGPGGKCHDECGCHKVVTGPHDFRRTFATRLLRSGLDIRRLQVLMGHSSPETTARYDKREYEEIIEARKKVRLIT